MEKVIFENDNREYLVVDIKNEPCPICGTQFKDIYFSWNIFHGEASASCCKAPYQMKSYYIENVSDECKNFVENIGKDNKIVLKVGEEYLEPCKRAIKEAGIQDIQNKDVYNLVIKYVKEKTQ